MLGRPSIGIPAITAAHLVGLHTLIAGPQDIVFNEIHYDAHPKTERIEFVELLNAGSVSVNLSGWRIKGIGKFTFPVSTTIDPGEFLLVTENTKALRARFGISTPFQYSGTLRTEGESLLLFDAEGNEIDRVSYQAGFPWPTAARGTGASMELLHPKLDNAQGGAWRSSVGGPTPGKPNSVAKDSPDSAPPAAEQVSHDPVLPTGGQEVRITIKARDLNGVASAILRYQIVDPGSYIRKSDAAYQEKWIETPMNDDGTEGDLSSGDSVYTAILPGELHKHRRLIRYRISLADPLGNKVTLPYPDDECPNFAYFVYDGAPSWTAARQPGVTEPETFSADLMANALPIYHLIARPADVNRSQYRPSSNGVRMWGTLVYEDRVYDHIKFFNRGEASTYLSGKNKWRFKFNRAREFAARDLHGRPYKTTWKTLNFNACASPWLPSHRGIAGLDEAVPLRLFQLAGVPASNSHWVHFRVIDEAAEAPTQQHRGDFWGLYQVIEQPDGRFLDERDLPDGNVYKIEKSSGDKKNQGPAQTTDWSDWSKFHKASRQPNTEEWWRSHLNLHAYYGFRAINRATGNIDLFDHSNYYAYNSPKDGRWRLIPWDLDITFMPVRRMSGGTVGVKTCLTHEAIRVEFKNRCRELIDLLFSDSSRYGGQAAQVVEELSQAINPPGLSKTLVDADEFLWSYHPHTSRAHRGPWYRRSVTESSLDLTNPFQRTIPTPDHEGFQQRLIDYMYNTDTDGQFEVGDGDQDGYGFNFLSLEAHDPDIPQRPSITYSGKPGYSLDGLRFASSAFTAPQGEDSFSSLQWRIGEVANPTTPGFVGGTPWTYEVERCWDSGRLATSSLEIEIPGKVLQPGRTYRVRVRHFDNTGRASHWSEPHEFVSKDPHLPPDHPELPR